MGVIKIQFSTSTAWQSAVIRRLSHSPFSHVDVQVPNGLLGASDSPTAPIIEGSPHGVAVRPADYQEFGIRRLAVISAPDDVIERFMNNVRGQLGKPFDSDAIYSFLNSDVAISSNWRDPERWFCSELVTWALEKAEFWPFRLLVPKNRVSPADLLLLLNPYMNTDVFWNTIPGLRLGSRER